MSTEPGSLGDFLIVPLEKSLILQAFMLLIGKGTFFTSNSTVFKM